MTGSRSKYCCEHCSLDPERHICPNQSRREHAATATPGAEPKPERQHNTMTQHTITRDGKPPLTFNGEEISSASNWTHNSNRWTTVTLYRTAGGKIVACVKRFTRWQGESDRVEAGSFPDLGQAIEWLKAGEDTLGGVSQEAVEDAIKANPELAKFWVEEVD